MASVLLDASWEQVSPEDVQVGTPAPHTSDVAELLASGHASAAIDMYAAHVTAEFEREDEGASEANMVDLWMAGTLLEAVSEQTQSATR